MSTPKSASRVLRFLASAALAAFLAASLPAADVLASEASDAHKQAKEMQSAWKKEKDEAKKAELKAQFDAFCKSKADILTLQKLSRLDLMYLGQIQGMAGMKAEAVATIRKAVESKEETQYGSIIHANLVQAILDSGDMDAAFAEMNKLREVYPGAKEGKVSAMNVGMASRAAGKHSVAVEALKIAHEAGEPSAIKPLCNSLLLLGQKDEAAKLAKEAVEKGVPQLKEDLLVHAEIVGRIGGPAPALSFDACVPPGEPEIGERVVVLGFWNMSAKTAKWVLRLMDSIKKGYGDDVVTLAVTTYYKKNAETGKIEDSVTPELERTQASAFRDQESFAGRMAFLKDEAAMKEWGVSALPHVVVIGKDKTLLFAHTMNVLDQTDTNILKGVLDKALGK